MFNSNTIPVFGNNVIEECVGAKRKKLSLFAQYRKGLISDRTGIIEKDIEAKNENILSSELDKTNETDVIQLEELKKCQVAFDANGELMESDDENNKMKLKDIILLCQSTCVQQRQLALSILEKMVSRSIDGYYMKNRIFHPISMLNFLLESGMVFIIRWNLDHPNIQVQLSALRLFSNLLYSSLHSLNKMMENEHYKLMWNEIDEKEKEDETEFEKDIRFIRLDLSLAFIRRLNIFKRFFYFIQRHKEFNSKKENLDIHVEFTGLVCKCIRCLRRIGSNFIDSQQIIILKEIFEIVKELSEKNEHLQLEYLSLLIMNDDSIIIPFPENYGGEFINNWKIEQSMKELSNHKKLLLFYQLNSFSFNFISNWKLMERTFPEYHFHHLQLLSQLYQVTNGEEVTDISPDLYQLVQSNDLMTFKSTIEFDDNFLEKFNWIISEFQFKCKIRLKENEELDEEIEKSLLVRIGEEKNMSNLQYSNILPIIIADQISFNEFMKKLKNYYEIILLRNEKLNDETLVEFDKLEYFLIRIIEFRYQIIDILNQSEYLFIFYELNQFFMILYHIAKSMNISRDKLILIFLLICLTATIHNDHEKLQKIFSDISIDQTFLEEKLSRKKKLIFPNNFWFSLIEFEWKLRRFEISKDILKIVFNLRRHNFDFIDNFILQQIISILTLHLVENEIENLFIHNQNFFLDSLKLLIVDNYYDVLLPLPSIRLTIVLDWYDGTNEKTTFNSIYTKCMNHLNGFGPFLKVLLELLLFFTQYPLNDRYINKVNMHQPIQLPITRLEALLANCRAVFWNIDNSILQLLDDYQPILSRYLFGGYPFCKMECSSEILKSYCSIIAQLPKPECDIITPLNYEYFHLLLICLSHLNEFVFQQNSLPNLQFLKSSIVKQIMENDGRIWFFEFVKLYDPTTIGNISENISNIKLFHNLPMNRLNVLKCPNKSD
ncbi:hypothetical protein SNEBB_008289 [Seison nebaliae]|nr:hypothetical protein SNEBB_008289 [Seison nebaliae]